VRFEKPDAKDAKALQTTQKILSARGGCEEYAVEEPLQNPVSARSHAASNTWQR
jgi:hypothetical protein